MTAIAVAENLAFDTYDALIDAINDWLDRSDLTGVAPQLIALCEARLRRELQPLMSETSATVAVTSGIGVFPADCDIIRLVEFDGGGLDQVNPVHGRQFPASEFDETSPRAYSLEANRVNVWPQTDCTLTVFYRPKLAALTSANSSNDLLAQHPDVYFYGALLFANGYVANDVRAALFKSLWDEAIAECKRFLGRQKWVNVRLRGPATIA